METAQETKRFRNLLTDEVITGHLTTEHACSSYGQPVWVDLETGEAFDLFGMEEITDEEE